MPLPDYNIRNQVEGVTVLEYDSKNDAEQVKSTFERVMTEMGLDEELPLFYLSGKELRPRKEYAENLADIHIEDSILDNRDQIAEEITKTVYNYNGDIKNGL